MESTARARYVRIAPRKVRLVMDMVRGKPVEEALQTLGLVRKAASPVLVKVIRSALANAENNFQMHTDGLLIKKAWVDEGPTMKRFLPRAMGRATPVRKRTSHITVVLSEK
ncbi:MAG: 50S ribosomal protein L22 [Proteobacteria bacterium]|nr:50S ribosomal protein L22 [Pseudomonadota bacterium]